MTISEISSLICKKIQENLVLVDLGNDYFVAKFTLQESVNKVLNEGPWFITGNFLRYANRNQISFPVKPLLPTVQYG